MFTLFIGRRLDVRLDEVLNFVHARVHLRHLLHNCEMAPRIGCQRSLAWSLRVDLWLSQRDERKLSFIRVRLLLLRTVVLWRIGLIVVPPKSCILRRIMKNRGIIVVRVCTRKICSSL